MIMNKKFQSKFIKFVLCLSVFGLVFSNSTLNAFLNFAPVARAAGQSQMCQTMMDVILIIDSSGSMADGAALSQCNWEALEWVGPSMQCVSHSQTGLTEAECLAKPNPVQCDAPVYTPATKSKMDAAKDAANSFLNNMGSADQSGLVSFADNATLDKPLSNNHDATKLAVNALAPFGSTNIGDAIAFGTAQFDS